jgi:hypothetical protein
MPQHLHHREFIQTSAVAAAAITAVALPGAASQTGCPMATAPS